MLLLASLLPTGAVAAPPVPLHYVAYAAGLPVLDLTVALDLEPAGYDVQTALRTIGVFGAFVSGLAATHVSGAWADLAAIPVHYDSGGVWKGERRRTVIDYAGGMPHVHGLLPDPDPEPREPVPPSLQAGTVDTLSAMASLLRRVAQSGRCDGDARLYDGRRLSELQARTGGMETLAATSRSRFAGPALRCDVEGRLLAGFRAEDDRARAGRLQHGTVWLAPISPNTPPVPVRIEFEAGFFGAATMYLAPG